jgi:hypothetical protein
MTRPSPRVVYIGGADCAAHAAPCSSCNADIGEACIPNRHTGPVPHQCRVDFAEAIGLRDISASPLFESPASAGDAGRPGSTGDVGRFLPELAGGASVSPAFFGDETL